MVDYSDVKAQLIQDREALSDLEYKVSTLDFDSDRVSYDVRTNLERAKQWLGKALAAIGTATPYPTSFDYKNPRIEPMANVKRTPLPENLLDGVDVENEWIAYAKWFRHQIKLVELSIWNTKQGVRDNELFQTAVGNAYTFCANAVMDFGMVLNEIYQEENGEPEVEETSVTRDELGKAAAAIVAPERKLDEADKPKEPIDNYPGSNEAGGFGDSANRTKEALQTGIGAPIDMPSAVHTDQKADDLAAGDAEAGKMRANYEADQASQAKKTAEVRPVSEMQPEDRARYDKAVQEKSNQSEQKAETLKATPKKEEAKTPAKTTETKKTDTAK